MQTFQTYFLSALRAALNNQTVSWESVSPADWRALFQLAQQHKVGPMIYEAVYHCPAAKRVPELMRAWKRQTMQQVLVQTQKTTEFLRLYAALREHGITPCVVKGILCRQLYPNPDERVSADEDLFVAPEQFAACHAFLLKYGMKPTAERTDLQTQFEVSYQKTNSPLYLELHQQLFSPDSDAYGDWNYYFTQIHAQPVEIFVDGVLLRSICFTCFAMRSSILCTADLAFGKSVILYCMPMHTVHKFSGINLLYSARTCMQISLLRRCFALDKSI